jgi:hypothetical protein
VQRDPAAQPHADFGDHLGQPLRREELVVIDWRAPQLMPLARAVVDGACALFINCLLAAFVLKQQRAESPWSAHTWAAEHVRPMTTG